MITFKPCQPWHIHEIDVQAAQRYEVAFNHGVTGELVRSSFALSAWDGDRCLGAGGYRRVWDGRAVAWIVLAGALGPAMRPVVRQLRAALDMCPARRIEMTVRADFLNGMRLADVLGFRCETPDGMQAFFPDGSDAYLFVRIKAT
jgi:hypothetical protein